MSDNFKHITYEQSECQKEKKERIAEIEIFEVIMATNFPKLMTSNHRSRKLSVTK